MVDIKTYAERHGISTQAVYKQIANHKEELKAHIVFQSGKRFLDDRAVSILEKYRYSASTVVVERENEEEVNELKVENAKLKNQLLELQSKYIALQEKNIEQEKRISQANEEHLKLEMEQEKAEKLSEEVQKKQEQIDRMVSANFIQRMLGKW